MKKYLIILGFIMCFLNSAAEAKTIKVSALTAFSTENPSPIFKVQTLEPLEIEDNISIESGTIVTGQVCRIQSPQRGKRDSYFEFIPTSLMYNEQIINLDTSNTIARIVGYEPITPTEIAKSVAKKSIGLFYKGATQGISFVEGIAKAEDGERIKSGLTKVYKDSPLSYIEIGDELNISEGDIIILKLKKIR